MCDDSLLRGALWDISNKTKSLPSEEESVQLLYRAIWVCNNTPFISESPPTPTLICRSHGRKIDDSSAMSEAESIKKAVFDGLEPPSWWDEVTANDHFDKVTEGRLVALRKLADIRWIRRRETRERLVSRTKRQCLRVGFSLRALVPSVGGQLQVLMVNSTPVGRKLRLLINRTTASERSAPAGSVPVSA